MKQDVIIRELKNSDIEDLRKLSFGLLQAQIDNNSFFHGLTLKRAVEVEEGIDNPSCCIFGAEYNKELIGFSNVELAERNFWFELSEHALLVDIFIDKSKYKNLNFYKIAFRLYKSCEDWAREHKMKYICADVYGDNTRVRRLLEKRGFREYRVKFVKELNG